MSRLVSGTLLSFRYSRGGKIKGLGLETARGLLDVELPPELRRQARRSLSPGLPVQLWLDPRTVRPTAAFLLPGSKLPPAPTRERLQVCCGKHCWRRGSGQLLEELQLRLGPCNVEVRECPCLKDCRNGPNVKLGGEVMRVSAKGARQFVECHF